ncbi:short chain dehydrogenase [compost metagenome]
MAQAIIVAADSDKALLRLTLGGDAYDLVHQSLSSRIAALEDCNATVNTLLILSIKA